MVWRVSKFEESFTESVGDIFSSIIIKYTFKK